MAVIWRSIFKELPADSQIVWVRILDTYGDSVQAQFNESEQNFTTLLTGIVIPAYQVARWKYL